MQSIDKIKKMLLPKFIANTMLLKGCASGDVSRVQKALKLGADINASVYVGSYEDAVAGSCPYEPGWEGDVKMSPLLYTITTAFGKTDEKKYQDVVRCLLENGADTSRVLFSSEKLWEWDKDRTDGWGADYKKKNAISLEEVLSVSLKEQVPLGERRSSRDFCCVSENMLSFLKTLNIPVVELKNGREVASSTKSHEKTQTNENASKLRNLGKKRNLFFNANANKGRSR